MNTYTNTEHTALDLPNQMVSSKKKQTKGWQRDTLDFFISNLTAKNTSLRKSKEEMRANIRLVNSSLNVDDFKDSFDPLDLDGEENGKNQPLKRKFYNIINNPLRTLFGEELKRRSDVRAMVVNQTAINQKDKEFQERLIQYMTQAAQQESVSEEDLQKKLSEFDKYRKYDLQSAHEKMANEVIQVLSNDRRINIKKLFNKGWESLNIIAEEIYRVGNIGDEPWLFNVNSENFHVMGMGDSHLIQDGFAWIEYDYMHPNKIIEEFNRTLTDSELKRILNYHADDVFASNINPVAATTVNNYGGVTVGEGMNSAAANGTFFSIDGGTLDETNWTNEDGDIRVVRVQWLSPRKIGELTYFDEFGDEQTKFVDEYYEAKIELGETIEWFWINEVWKGEKIGADIYTDIKPLDVQMRSITNPAIVMPSYIGAIDTLQGGAARCVVDDIRAYQEDYNVWMLKLKQLWVQHLGKAAVIDISRIPSSMDTKKWFYWLKTFGISFENPFEESTKGQVSGMMQQTGRNIDLSHAEEINQAIQYLAYLEQQINKLAAAPEPRQGNLTGNEGLGVSQEAIMRSTTQTEVKFQLHEDIKAYVYTSLIEYTKVLWKDNKVKRQYLLDDLSNYIIDIDGAVLNEAEYGVQTTNSTRVFEMENNLNTLAHAAIQNGLITFSDVAKMGLSTSVSEKITMLENAEEKRMKQQNESEQMRIQAQQQDRQAEMEFEQIKHQQELEKIDREYQYKLQLKQLELDDKAESDVYKQLSEDDNQNGVEDQVELDKEMIAQDTERMKLDAEDRRLDKEIRSKEKIEMAKLTTAREIASKNAISKNKK